MARVMRCVRGERAIQSNAADSSKGTRMSALGRANRRTALAPMSASHAFILESVEATVGNHQPAQVAVGRGAHAWHRCHWRNLWKALMGMIRKIRSNGGNGSS